MTDYERLLEAVQDMAEEFRREGTHDLATVLGCTEVESIVRVLRIGEDDTEADDWLNTHLKNHDPDTAVEFHGIDTE